jgi:hypothetical protein
MPIANVAGVNDDAKNLANFLQEVLDRVINVYDSFNMPLPSRRYYTFGVPAVDCEQVVVSMIQMYIGTPGDEANEPRRCNDPRSATLNISISRAVPITQANGAAPLADDIQDAAHVCALDAWILMESVNDLDTWGEQGFPGLGVIATLDANQPEGGFTTTRLTITMAIP